MSRKKTQLYMDRQKNQQKRKKQIILLVVLVIVIIAALGLYNIFKPAPYNVSATSSGDLVIPIDELEETVTYIQHKNLNEDLIIWVDDSGQPRVAYDVCEECFSSGNAHYVYNSGTLTCANCGNSMDIENLGIASWGGCQPVAIPVDYRNDTDSEIVIPASVLEYSDAMFTRWQAGYYDMVLEDYEVE